MRGIFSNVAKTFAGIHSYIQAVIDFSVPTAVIVPGMHKSGLAIVSKKWTACRGFLSIFTYQKEKSSLKNDERPQT